mmetsp:Transcript_28189/g.87824  ORF Transcript_28189/g.87824 Transcript_28189/m.87824 type:complete len:279 (+) Transcript_28189:41-877(+)
MASSLPGNALAEAGKALAVAQDDMRARLQGVLDRFEVTVAEANDLVGLEDYEIVLIVDDSGSMCRSATPPEVRKIGRPTPSRWDEAKEAVSMIAEIGCCFDSSGIDVFFLNRSGVKGVKGAGDPALAAALQGPPRGRTPLTEMLGAVAQECGGERPVLLFILTDGEPNGGAANFSRQLRRLVKKQSTQHTFRVQIMACTANEDEIGWLNRLDAELKEVDVTDDYYSERAEVQRAGLAQRFNRADWIMKAMLGPISSKFDAWDEGPHVVDVQCDACAIQ